MLLRNWIKIIELWRPVNVWLCTNTDIKTQTQIFVYELPVMQSILYSMASWAYLLTLLSNYVNWNNQINIKKKKTKRLWYFKNVLALSTNHKKHIHLARLILLCLLKRTAITPPFVLKLAKLKLLTWLRMWYLAKF